MSDRTKELILKTVIVIGAASGLMLFPGSVIFVLFGVDEKTIVIIWYTFLGIFFVAGSLLIVLLFVWGDIKQKPVKAEKEPLKFSSYNDFLCFTHDRLLQKEYQMQKKVLVSSDVEVYLYLKSTKLWTLECFAIIRAPELTEEVLDNTNDSITDILIEYYGSQKITDTINMISVFCVDRISSAFRKLVNGNLQQGIKNGRFNVGISFGGKTIYMARQKDGYAILVYKRLRKVFIDIMDIHKNKK